MALQRRKEKEYYHYDESHTILLLLSISLSTIFLIVPVGIFVILNGNPFKDVAVTTTTISAWWYSSLQIVGFGDNDNDTDNRTMRKTASTAIAIVLMSVVYTFFVQTRDGEGSENNINNKEKFLQQRQTTVEDTADDTADTVISLPSSSKSKKSNFVVGTREDSRASARNDHKKKDSSDFSAAAVTTATTTIVTDKGQDEKKSESPTSLQTSEVGNNAPTLVSPATPDYIDDSEPLPPIQVVQEHDNDDGTSSTSIPFILSRYEMQQLSEHIPTIFGRKWNRKYSIARDGDSFEACLRLIGDVAPTLMVVRTKRNDVFGGFADMPWNHTKGKFFGGSKACLFRINKNNTTSSKAGNNADGAAGNQVNLYKWTFANRYIQLCDPIQKRLAFGGGGQSGSFGLSVENNFLTGSTGHCDTFNNPGLCEQEHFQILDFEVYTFPVW